MNNIPGVSRAPLSGRHTDTGIEAVRGIAALFVALSHLLYLNLLTPDLRLAAWLQTVEGGHAGVLVFFVLSGYVIGWTNAGPFTPAAASAYIRRRTTRLAPIYLVAMVLTVAVIGYTGLTESLRVIVGSFLCLQNFNGYFGFSLNPPLVNGPLWSLNYEVLYYGVFLAVWRFKPDLKWVFAAALVPAALGWFAPAIMPLFIASYACGWIFWAAGLWLSRQPALGKSTASPIATWILLVFAGHQIGGGARMLNVLGFYSNDAGMVGLADLALLPAILLAMAAVSHRKLPGRGGVEALAWLSCLVPLAGMIVTGRLMSHPSWITGFVAVIIAGCLRSFRHSSWLRPFYGVGGIYYGLYFVPFPRVYLVQFMPLPRTSLEGFAARLAIWVPMTLGLSWFLERRFQPWVKARLFAGE